MLSVEKIYELSAGAELHLVKLEEFVEHLRDFTDSMKAIKRSQDAQVLWELQQVREEIGDLRRQLKRYGLPEINQYEKRLETIRESLQSDQWPLAVDPTSICDTEDAVQMRAEAIITFVVGEYLRDRKFLDYGCGQGHTVMAAQEKETRLAVGYDIDLSECKLQGPLFTADFNEVVKNAPYDVILVHDVLDHIKQIDPLEALKQVRSVLHPNGKVYVRNHPWSSRHGGHLYKQINRAFLHLVLDDVELTRVGGWICEHNLKVIRPLATYQHWFHQSGFQIKSEIPVRRKVEDFFLTPSHVHSRLLDLWGKEEELEPNLEIELVEYILETTSNQQVF